MRRAGYLQAFRENGCAVPAAARPRRGVAGRERDYLPCSVDGSSLAASEAASAASEAARASLAALSAGCRSAGVCGAVLALPEPPSGRSPLPARDAHAEELELPPHVA